MIGMNKYIHLIYSRIMPVHFSKNTKTVYNHILKFNHRIIVVN